ncbi:HPr family phosphocarrier protein [Candidatus Nanohalovita haloferacivicina]|uniref:HPr family phosphocarrier protein n=1 Tax=Candidatus Nanohalovita haloferacivicina TaxID=2978046 RepID=UPI00325FA8BC|nr:Phosphocarrier protein HPr [Candidatus Nanohalobia archaeon BNXNv]
MKRQVEIVPEAGLHARPASKFVETAQEYNCDLKISDAEGDEEPVDARSMLAVTSLGLKQGDKMEIQAEGDDAEEALNALEEIITTPEE